MVLSQARDELNAFHSSIDTEFGATVRHIQLCSNVLLINADKKSTMFRQIQNLCFIGIFYLWSDSPSDVEPVTRVHNQVRKEANVATIVELFKGR